MRASPTDYLANERTFLAWVRTGITLVALGFVVARFNLLIRELGGTTTASPYSDALGVALVLLGAGVVVLAQLRQRSVRRLLDAGRFEASDRLLGAVTAAMVVAGVALAIYLVATV
ncbi:MAG: DUF202 domain-containing protein [Thermoplasmata archaeon]